MLSLFQAVKRRLFHLRFRSNILNADDPLNGRQFQNLRDFMRHILTGPDDEDATRRGLLQRGAHLGGMSRQDENSAPHRHDAALFVLSRAAG